MTLFKKNDTTDENYLDLIQFDQNDRGSFVSKIDSIQKLKESITHPYSFNGN